MHVNRSIKAGDRSSTARRKETLNGACRMSKKRQEIRAKYRLFQSPNYEIVKIILQRNGFIMISFAIEVRATIGWVV